MFFFTADFWYRNSFTIPSNFSGKNIWLNFNGINWKAEVFLNGVAIGRIDGAFHRGKFNITPLVKQNAPNILAVFIQKNDNPGHVTEQHLNDPDGNGGIIGRDSPTIMAGIGWNWVPTIRGRNCGIWDNVFLSATGNVELTDPMVVTDLNLPDTTIVNISISVQVKNLSNQKVEGYLNASFQR
jgi:hypothetical protein